MFYAPEMLQSFLLGACEWISILCVCVCGGGVNSNEGAEIIRCYYTEFSRRDYEQLP
jgi:hypothetical protein